jgi:hypothetical protein
MEGAVVSATCNTDASDTFVLPNGTALGWRERDGVLQCEACREAEE